MPNKSVKNNVDIFMYVNKVYNKDDFSPDSSR